MSDDPFVVRDVRDIADEPDAPDRVLFDHGISARRGEITIVHAPPNTGKTFIALHVALTLASRGLSTLLVSTETSDHFLRKRVRALARHSGVDVDSTPGRVLFLRGALSMLDPDCVDRLSAIMKERDIALLVMDPWVDVLAGAEENDAATMHAAMRATRTIIEASDAACLLAHHTRKTGDVGRGSSAIDAAADAVFVVRSDRSGSLVECRKQRNAARSGDTQFILSIDDTDGSASVDFVPLSGSADFRAKKPTASSTSRDKQLRLVAFAMRQPSVRVSDLKRHLSISGTDAAKFLSHLTELGLLQVRETTNGKVYSPK